MFIETEQTPNPSSLKFLPGCEVLGQGTAAFSCVEEASISPLARRIFEVAGVTGVFLGSDFITITKTDALGWPAIRPQVLGIIMEHFTTGQPVMADEYAASEGIGGPDGLLAEESEVIQQIREILETRVRPAVAQDGGDIVFHSFDNGVVYLQMRGACAGCPSSTMTLKAGVENLLKHFIPEVTEVRAVN